MHSLSGTLRAAKKLEQTSFVVRLKMLETQDRQCIVMYHCLNDDAENEGASQQQGT